MSTFFLKFLLIPILWSPSLQASSFELCEFKVKILGQTKTHLQVELIDTIVSPGFNAGKNSLACQGKIIKDQIPLTMVTRGKSLAIKGVTLKAEWRSYSTMGAKGPFTSTTWSFYKLPE